MKIIEAVSHQRCGTDACSYVEKFARENKNEYVIFCENKSLDKSQTWHFDKGICCIFVRGIIVRPVLFLFVLSEANIFTVSFAFVLVLDLRGKLFSCAYFTMLNIYK